MNAAGLRSVRKENGTRDELERLGWYHGFRFPDGTEIPGVLPVEVSEARYAEFPIPGDLSGKRVLDIGAWDGWFSFEAERRGAAVTAIDMIEAPNFHVVHQKLGSRVEYRELDLFEVPGAGLGRFNYVFFLGVLYHTKHPLLALEIVCGLTAEIAIVESYVTDAADWDSHRDEIPSLEFYEAEELGGQLDNWFGPTVGCLIALSRAAGFARVELLSVDGANNRAALACYRKWTEPDSGPRGARAALKSVTNAIRGGWNFRSKRDEYITWWFDFAGEGLHRDDLKLRLGDVGVPAIYCSRSEGTLWSANSRLPPATNPGWHEARLSIRNGAWSEPRRIAVDMQPRTSALEVRLARDGRDWRRYIVNVSAPPAPLSLWVAGLGENCDPANTRILLRHASSGSAFPLKVTFIGEQDEKEERQVNAELPPDMEPGECAVTVSFGGVDSPPVLVRAVRD